MTQLTLDKDILIKRLEGIEAELAELSQLAKQDLAQFTAGPGWKLAQFHLHRALEGVFNISTHILSRLPGGVATQYKEVALQMGHHLIVPPEFADTKLVKMAKYRNRLVHFYAEVTPDELYQILNQDLGDFDIFLSAIKDLLDHPEKIGLTLE